MYERQEPQRSVQLTLFAADSLARTSAEPARAQGLPGSALDSGTNTGGSSVNCAPASRSSRTSRREKNGGCARCGPTCMLSVTERVPSKFLRPMSGSPIVESASSSWPTPTVSGLWNRKGASEYSGDGLSTAVRGEMWPTPTAQGYGSNQGGAAGRTGPVRLSLAGEVKLWPTPQARDEKGPSGAAGRARRSNLPDTLLVTGPLSPTWVEALMGCPIGWTERPPDVVPSSTGGSRRARP